MSHIIKLEIIAYAVASSQENWDKVSQAWFEGFAAAMNKNGAITDEEYGEVLNALIIITGGN